MDIVVSTLFGVGAATAWLVLATALAVLGGRVNQAREMHERPVASGTLPEAVPQR